MAQHCSVAILSTAISRMYWYKKLVQIYLTLISQNMSSRIYFSVLNKSVVVYDLLVSWWLWLAYTAHFNHIWRIFCQYTNSPPKCPAHLVFIQNCSLVLSKFYEFINKSVWTKKNYYHIFEIGVCRQAKVKPPHISHFWYLLAMLKCVLFHFENSSKVS